MSCHVLWRSIPHLLQFLCSSSHTLCQSLWRGPRCTPSRLRLLPTQLTSAACLKPRHLLKTSPRALCLALVMPCGGKGTPCTSPTKSCCLGKRPRTTLRPRPPLPTNALLLETLRLNHHAAIAATVAVGASAVAVAVPTTAACLLPLIQVRGLAETSASLRTMPRRRFLLT